VAWCNLPLRENSGTVYEGHRLTRCKCGEWSGRLNTNPVSHDPAIITLFGPRKFASSTPTPFTGSAWRNFGRLLGRTLVFLSIPLFLLSGYLAFAHYWIQTRWTRSEATVLSGEIRQRSSGSTSTRGAVGASSNSYFFHCTVSYSVAGKTRQSELDLPGSPYRMDAQARAARWSEGQTVSIQYEPSNPSKIRLADNPAEITAIGSLREASYFFLPGILLILTSRSERVDSQ